MNSGVNPDELELPALHCTQVRQADACAAVALVRCFKVGYRSVPTIQSGHYNTLKGYPDGMNPVSTSGGMSPAPNPRVAVPPR